MFLWSITVVKTELTTQESIKSGKSVSFPDDNDDLIMFGGEVTKIVLPNSLFRLALKNLSSGMFVVFINILILLAKMF